jgi:hypothetical protein
MTTFPVLSTYPVLAWLSSPVVLLDGSEPAAEGRGVVELRLDDRLARRIDVAPLPVLGYRHERGLLAQGNAAPGQESGRSHGKRGSDQHARSRQHGSLPGGLLAAVVSLVRPAGARVSRMPT